MRKRNKVLKLHGKKSYVRAMRRNMVTSLVLFEKLKTTKARSKMAVNDFNKIISIVKKKDDLQSRKAVDKILFDKNAVSKVLDIIKQRFKKIKKR